MITRKDYPHIFSDLYKNKIRFIAGPRQSGKTTLAKKFLKDQGLQSLYYNWDRREIRDMYYENSYFYNDNILSLPQESQKWVCFDEIHKMPEWKNILKDMYDTEHEKIRFIVTGSARLDLFRQSGDSLTGRYYLFHLFPLCLRELAGLTGEGFYSEEDMPSNALSFIEERLGDPVYHQDSFMQLLNFSGFPEPLVESKEKLHRMWKNNYIDTLLKEDVRDFSTIKNLENLAKLSVILPQKIGSPLSVNSLTRDLHVSYPAVKNYIHLLELCYFIFKIPPFSQKISRAIKKEQKVYYFDWTRIPDPGVRFENYVAFELFTIVTFLTDHGFGNFQLYFVRNRRGQETDFLITLEGEPWLLLEAKLNEESVDGHHLRQAETLGDIPFVQIVHRDKVAKKPGKKVFIVSASRFFS